MKTDNLSEAIEHLEKAEELLRSLKIDEWRMKDICRAATSSIAHHAKILRNELHYAEKESLANWLRLSNNACTGLAPTAAQDGTGEAGASQ